MDKNISVPIDLAWDMFIQFCAILGILGSVIASIVIWQAKRSIGLADKLVTTTNLHSNRIENHEVRILTVEKRQDEFKVEQDSQREQIYLVTYSNQKSLKRGNG